MFTICDARVHADGAILTPQNHPTKPPNKTTPQNRCVISWEPRIAARFRGDPGSLRDFAGTSDRCVISRGPRVLGGQSGAMASSSARPDAHPHRRTRQTTSLAGG
jgi:hypothetical protein